MLPSLGPRRRAAAWRVWSVALLAPEQQQGLAVLGAQVLGPSQVLTPPAGHQRNGETGDLRAFSREFTFEGGANGSGDGSMPTGSEGGAFVM